MSFAVPGYSGMLYQKGNSKTPLLTNIMGRQKFSNSVKFVLGQDYVEEEGVIPNISESASLTAPDPTYVTRNQAYNVTQIFHETLAISDAKRSNMGTLGGVNIAGQIANPQNELDFQIARKMSKIRNSIEKTFINGTFNEATSDVTVNKTRGLVAAITTNVMNASGEPLDLFMIDRMLATMDNNGADISSLTLLCDNITASQVVGNAIELGVEVGKAFENAYGISIREIITQNGRVFLMSGKYLPAGTALVLNLPAISPVGMIVPGKGNFYLEELGKAGAGEKYQIFGQMGIDYGVEFLHGKFTNLSIDYARPIGRKVVTVSADATLGTLEVTSEAGSTTGKTKVTVVPTKATGNAYKIKTAATVEAPEYNDVCTTGYSDWDGTADITATTGNKILIVEVDSTSNRARKAGIATVTSKA